MIKEVEDFPWEAEFSSEVTSNFLRNKNDVLIKSIRFYEVRDPSGAIILAAGIGVWSYVRRPELWIAMAKPFLRNLRQSVKLTREALQLPASQYPDLICEVRKNTPTHVNFVKHFGWRPTGVGSIRPDGDNFIQYELNHGN